MTFSAALEAFRSTAWSALVSLLEGGFFGQ